MPRRRSARSRDYNAMLAQYRSTFEWEEDTTSFTHTNNTATLYSAIADVGAQDTSQLRQLSVQLMMTLDHDDPEIQAYCALLIRTRNTVPPADLDDAFDNDAYRPIGRPRTVFMTAQMPGFMSWRHQTVTLGDGEDLYIWSARVNGTTSVTSVDPVRGLYVAKYKANQLERDTVV